MTDNTSALTFASSLDYALTSSSPPISRTDIASWKAQVAPDVTHHFVERQEELRKEYQALVEKYNNLLAHYDDNRCVYNSEINFIPVVGQTYFLYEVRNKRFLSMIAPEHASWSGYLGSFRLTSPHVWSRVDSHERN